MSSRSSLGKDCMELYALVAVAIITIALLHKKFTRDKPQLDPMDLDDMLDCAPLQPPSPMSIDSSSDGFPNGDELVVVPDYIK